MIPWNRLSRDLQKRILTLALMSGAASVDGCTPPIIYDPPPPPSTTPEPSQTHVPASVTYSPSPASQRSSTPMICDPAPPPRTATTSVKPPIICDPAPPPRTATVGAQNPQPTISGQVSNLQITSDPTVSGARVTGMISGADGKPRGGIKIELISDATTLPAVSDPSGAFVVNCAPGTYTLVVGGDKDNSVKFSLQEHGVATVKWALTQPTPGAMLPLAEIRTVDIVWSDDLTFSADAPWPGAKYRWLTTGGELVNVDDVIRWVPPQTPGRYLLQLIADWGYEGLAVDAVTLTVFPNGSVYIT